MPAFQVHRLKESQQQQFRWPPHTSGTSIVKPKDYDLGESIDAETPYAAWEQLRRGLAPLKLGDLLESDGGELRIFKYIGFEEARWWVPEPPSGPIPQAAEQALS
jgi:hypothetical protein